MNDDTSGTSGGHHNDFNNDGVPDNGFYSDPYDDRPHHHHYHSGFGHDIHHGRRRRRGHMDLSTAPTWVKVFAWVGALTAIAGIGIAALGIIGSAGDAFDRAESDRFPGVVQDDPFPGGGLPGGDPFPGGQVVTVEGRALNLDDFREDKVVSPVGTVGSRTDGPGPVGLGFGLFFVGFVPAAVAALGYSTSKRR